MKNVLVAFLLFVTVVAYSLHRKGVREAEEAAAEQARSEARAEAQAVLEKERDARRTADMERERADRERLAREEAERQRPSMAISKVVEPLLISVLAPLNVAQPADIVPTIEITKQRVLDRQVHAEAGRIPVFERQRR